MAKGIFDIIDQYAPMPKKKEYAPKNPPSKTAEQRKFEADTYRALSNIAAGKGTVQDTLQARLAKKLPENANGRDKAKAHKLAADILKSAEYKAFGHPDSSVIVDDAQRAGNEVLRKAGVPVFDIDEPSVPDPDDLKQTQAQRHAAHPNLWTKIPYTPEAMEEIPAGKTFIAPDGSLRMKR